MMNTVIMMMIFLTKVKITFPEQSLQDMPPVPRHLWQALTTPVCGTVTTLTWELTIKKQIRILRISSWSSPWSPPLWTYLQGAHPCPMVGELPPVQGHPPRRPGQSWFYGHNVIKTNLVRSICPAGFSFLRERLQLIVVSRHIVHTWVDYNRDAVSRFLIDERDWFVMVDHDENDMMIISG